MEGIKIEHLTASYPSLIPRICKWFGNDVYIVLYTFTIHLLIKISYPNATIAWHTEVIFGLGEQPKLDFYGTNAYLLASITYP